MEQSKKRYKKPYKNRGPESKKDLTDRVVYTTKETGPKKYAPWQLKLMAISQLWDKQDDPCFSELVEIRYQELLNRQG